MSEEHYRQVEECQEEFETTLDDDEANTARDEWDVKTLFEHMSQNVDALTALGKDPRTSELTVAECLIALARELLPFRTKIKWDELAAADESAHSDLSRFLQFLRDRAELMQDRRPYKPPTATCTSQIVTHRVWHEKTATDLQVSVADRCFVCRESHRPSDCFVIRMASRSQRRALARKADLCFLCLSSGHLAKECDQSGAELRECCFPSPLSSGWSPYPASQRLALPFPLSARMLFPAPLSSGRTPII
ncbi:hypothetical protein T10_12924 [Trichinella papuae]|uniref:CCHC-type domain-containing protein n=1 Tax=Trichinella papuae TaxID=268474 RepID=A0A0V1M4L0_9BILA|nr:hypothetical protein T10_12924 [Trichinella papuae]